jgi:hypothetical protein
MHSGGNIILFEQLITLGQQAHATEHHEAAYHVLCAAMHLAADDNNIDQLNAVAEIAKTQLTWINENAVENRMSTSASHKRGGIDFYMNLGRLIDAHIRLVKSHLG